MRYALTSAKVAAAALLLFAIPIGMVLAIALGPWLWLHRPVGIVYVATLIGSVGLSVALVAVLRERDPAYARTLLRYSAAAVAIAALTMAVAYALQPGYMDPLGLAHG